MTDSAFDNMMNSKLNRSFSEIFKGPLLPHFGSKSVEEPLTEEQMMEKRLAKHLPKSRSSRKQKTSKSKTKSITNLDPLEEDQSSRTLDTSPHSSSSSIDHDLIMMDDSDNKKEQKDAIKTIRQAESKKVKASRPASPRQASGKPKAAPLRRTKSLEGITLMVPSDRKHQTPKARSKKMSDRSAPNITRSPTRRSTNLRKSASAKDIDSAAAGNKKLRRNTTKSGMNTKHKAERRSPLREYSSELLRSHSPAQTKERRGSAKSSSKERRGSVKSNSKERRENRKEKRDILGDSNHSDGTPQQRKTSLAHGPATTNCTALSTCTASITPACIHVGHWTCDCGSVLRDRMNFCGLCGTPKHWTCENCHFTENLCRFVFCGDCGVPRESSDSKRSADSFPMVVSVYDKVEQD